MSLFDDLAKNVLGQLSDGASGEAAAGAGGTNWIQLAMSLLQKVGGIEGLMAKFQQGDLGSLVSSWVGTGENLPISAEQIKAALGGVLPQVAAEADMDTNTAAQGLASVLPDLVSQLTPNGEAGEFDLQKAAESLLGGGGLSKLFS